MVDKPQPVQIMQVDLKIIIDKIQLHNISIMRFAPGTETNCNEKALEAFIYPPKTSCVNLLSLTRVTDSVARVTLTRVTESVTRVSDKRLTQKQITQHETKIVICNG